jgi:predicted RNA binding protein YcfA (HicA-like mRNA interferase family)
MASYYRDLIKALNNAGCEFTRNGKGSHEIWFSPISQRYFTVVKDIQKKHTANEILKQAGLPKQF